VKFPSVLVALEDGKLKPKHVGPYDYLIIKESDTLDGNFILTLL
jgi:hypothetical protein